MQSWAVDRGTTNLLPAINLYGNGSVKEEGEGADKLSVFYLPKFAGVSASYIILLPKHIGL
jgi:hypothetical protein